MASMCFAYRATSELHAKGEAALRSFNVCTKRINGTEQADSYTYKGT